MRVGRIVSAWLGALCLGAVLTAGCAVAGGKTGQAEAVQAASDGSECRAAERMGEANKIWKEAVFEPRRQQKEPDLTRMPELEKRYREIVTCMKPSLQAGKLADPQEQKLFSGAMYQWTIALSYLGRKEEAGALAAERLELIDAGLLGVEPMLERRTAAMRTGNLTRTRELAEAIIAMALEAGVPAGDIEEWVETRWESEIPGVGGPRGEEFTAYFRAAVIARRKLDKLDRMFQTSVCGKVVLADGGNGEITATVFNGFKKYSVTAKPDGSYCLPVIQEERRGVQFIFLTASRYRPQGKMVKVAKYGEGQVPTLPDATLVRMKKKRWGAIVGTAVYTYSGSRSGIDSVASGNEVTAKGRKRTYRTVMDQNGIFVLEAPPGLYSVAITGSSAALKRGGVTVKSGESTVFNFSSPMTIFD